MNNINLQTPKVISLKRIHIIGRKNSGKTTLIVDLVEYLSSLGYRVGTIKHTHHHHELDTPGKDSHQHRQAGAAAVGILSPGMSAIFWPAGPGDDVSDPYVKLYQMFADCDLVLVEGHAQTEGIKLEVWRAAISAAPLAVTDDSIHAVVTDDSVQLSEPVWSRSDIPSLAARLLSIAGSNAPAATIPQDSICIGAQ